MNLPRLWTVSQELDPYRVMRREMENAFRAFDQKPSSPGHWGWCAGGQCGGNK